MVSFFWSPLSDATATNAASTRGEIRMSTSLPGFPIHSKTMHHEKQRDHNRGPQQAAFRSVSASADQVGRFPAELIPGHIHCKPAQIRAEQGQHHVPSEVQTNGQ